MLPFVGILNRAYHPVMDSNHTLLYERHNVTCCQEVSANGIENNFKITNRPTLTKVSDMKACDYKHSGRPMRLNTLSEPMEVKSFSFSFNNMIEGEAIHLHVH